MRRFHIGLVSEYSREKDGYRIVLDTGQSALVPLERPVEERFLAGTFSDELFERNYGVALYTDRSGRGDWLPAQICAIIMGAAFRRDGRLQGMENWSPDWQPDIPPPGPASPALQEGTITVGLVGGTAAPYYLRGGSPGYVQGGAVLKEAVAAMRIVEDGATLRGAAAKEAVKTLRDGSGVGVHFARVDFAYTRTREIVHMQKTSCVDQEYAAGE